MSLPHLPTSVDFHQDITLHIQEDHQWRVRLMHSLILVWFLSTSQLPNSQCGAYHSINHLLQKSEAFQSVHHVTFILCYTVLYDFFALVFALIRVRKH